MKQHTKVNNEASIYFNCESIGFKFTIKYHTKIFNLTQFPGNCEDGDVKLENDGSPFIFLDDKWSPICGHWFWDNNNGAKAFCKKLGYPSGTLQKIRRRYSKDALRVGRCREGEDLMACTWGCNEYETGVGCASCSKSDAQSISITCTDQTDIVASSCGIKGKTF